MTCINCIQQAFHSRLCKQCFTTAINRRVGRFLNEQQLLRQPVAISLPKSRDVESAVTTAIFKAMVKFPYTEDDNGIAVIPWSVERELEQRLHTLLQKNNGNSKEKTAKNSIKLLQNVTIAEQKAYGKANNISYEEKNLPQSDEQQLLAALCRNDASLKFGLLKSTEML